jgi:transcriptional regulator with XRE-family HTH domain
MREMNAVDEKQIEAEENFVLDAQFLLQDLMAEQGISRAELSRRAGISKARISQLMKAGANPTLRNMARLFHALGADIGMAKKAAVRSEVASHGLAPLAGRLGMSAGWQREAEAPPSHSKRDQKVALFIEYAKRRANTLHVAEANDNSGVSEYIVERRYG